MSKDYRAKVFKSGNSVALRLPKSFGLREGDDVNVVPHDDGSFTFWLDSEGARVLDSLFGTFSAGFMSQGRGGTEQAERDWTGPSRDEAA